jgi:hypothetical protein
MWNIFPSMPGSPSIIYLGSSLYIDHEPGVVRLVMSYF